MSPLIKNYLLGLFLLTLSLCSVLLLSPKIVHAVSGSDWRGGNIIDDGVFYNNNDMSVYDIQNFLNNKVSCDTWGSKRSEWGGGTRAQYGASKGYPAPYTCLKDYSQDGKSAAQIIKESADTHRISSRSLIVLLQKEQALITDEWPWPNQYRSATGYGCPDTAPCDSEYYGFKNQVNKAAYQFRRYATFPNEYRYKPYQNNYIQYNPVSSCGGTNVYIENLATAGLYNYTPYQPNSSALDNLYGSGNSCGAYGNRNFWRLFNEWFGSTKALNHTCDSKVGNVVCIWSLIKPDGSQFLTPSVIERENVINNYGWRLEGIAFYASSTQRAGTVPVYRLRTDSKHYYTANTTERSVLLNSGGWADEGVSFFSYPSNIAGNVSQPIYTLYSPSGDKHFMTKDGTRRQLLIQNGYVPVSSTFSGLSRWINPPIVSPGRSNIYRLRGSTNYFYTTSLLELETVMEAGYTYEGVITTANSAASGTVIYRLRDGDGYFYTSSTEERDRAVSTYGMGNEGVAFYVDDSSAKIYRLSNTITGRYLYTSSTSESFNLTNNNGWKLEGMLADKNQSTSEVYRFINKYNHRHFYTIDLNEATRISNRGWQYEAVAFSASKSNGTPVYRLLFRDKHLFTANINEKNIAVSKYGYLYEGVAFYASEVPTASPVYRLQGGNDEYLYTASTSEKDTARSKYGYQYEGVGFYLPAEN